jgi:WD40 repeat protein
VPALVGPSPVRAVSVDSDAQVLLSSSNQGFSVWSAPELQKMESMPATPMDYNVLNVSHDAERALLMSKKKRRSRGMGHPLSPGNVADPYPQHARAALSGDGRWVVAAWRDSSMNDNAMIALDVNSGQARHLGAHPIPITALAASGDGRRALSVSFDGVAMLWDLNSGQMLRSFRSPFYILKVTMDFSGRRALAAGFDEKVVLWDLETGTLRDTFGTGLRFVGNLALSADCGLAVICGDDDSLTVWSTGDGKMVASLMLSRFPTAVSMQHDFIFFGDATGRRSLRLMRT